MLGTSIAAVTTANTSSAARRCICGAVASSSSLQAPTMRRSLSTSTARRREDDGTDAMFSVTSPKPTLSSTQYGRRTGPYTNATAAPTYTPFSSSYAQHRLHVHASSNNTILTLTTATGEPLAACSGGSVGFRKAQRSGYEAAYRAAFKVFRDIEDKRIPWGLSGIEIVWNGFGQGREAVFRALLATEGQLVRSLVRRMTDKTPLKIGGVRPKKKRML